jgi:aminoglycoside phosphotransferase (APT) family kinase protein
MKKTPPSSPRLTSDEPLVLTHGDLVPHNIILDDQNRVWIIDWGFAGVYPRWLEWVTMVGWWGKLRFGRWAAFFIAGYYPRQMGFISSIAWALETGRLM